MTDPSERIVLSGPQVAYIAKYHPNGVDICARGEFVHMRGPDDERGGLVGGELSSRPGMAGCIGMSRDTFLTLPERSESLPDQITPTTQSACPDCGGALVWVDGFFHCQGCCAILQEQEVEKL